MCVNSQKKGRWYINKTGAKILEYKDNSQIELVEGGVNGKFCQYPGDVLKFLERVEKKELKFLGNNGYKKVQKYYSGEVVAKNFVNQLKYFLKYKKFKQLVDFNKFERDYFKKIKDIEIKNTNYFFQKKIWNLFEYSYLIIRKVLKKLKINIENSNDLDEIKNKLYK